jgi:hypothetical protein
MLPLPKWMRGALLATAIMNIGGSAAFLPGAEALRAFGGMPEDGHPLYMMTVGLFILSFGLGYLYAGITGTADRLFIAIAALGKLTFFGLLVYLWLDGELPWMLPAAGTGDLAFGSLFLWWLAGLNRTGEAGV